MTDYDFFILVFFCLIAILIALGGVLSDRRKFVYLKVAFFGFLCCLIGMLPVFAGENVKSIIFLEQRLGFARSFLPGAALFSGGILGYLVRGFREWIGQNKK